MCPVLYSEANTSSSWPNIEKIKMEQPEQTPALSLLSCKLCRFLFCIHLPLSTFDTSDLPLSLPGCSSQTPALRQRVGLKHTPNIKNEYSIMSFRWNSPSLYHGNRLPAGDVHGQKEKKRKKPRLQMTNIFLFSHCD